MKLVLVRSHSVAPRNLLLAIGVLCAGTVACVHSRRAENVTVGDDASRHASSRPQLVATASGRRVLALVDAINAGDSATILRFGEEHYNANALAESGGRSRLLSRWLEIRETVGPIAIDTVLTSSTTSTTAWARGITSRAWLNFRMSVDSSPPHGILRVSLGRGIRPSHARLRLLVLSESELPVAISAYMEGLARADLFSGVVVLSGPRGILFAKAYGLADRAGRRMTTDTPFDVASIGKTFTTVAVGRLLDQGRLRLEDTVGRYLSELPAQLRRLTIEQLLEHSSGLGELGPGLDTAMRRARSVSEMLTQLADTSLAFTPGTNFLYSNRGYILLGAVVERVSGLPYHEFLLAQVFRRAELARTTLGPVPPDDRAHRYTRFPTLRSPYTPGARVDFDPQDDLAPGPHGGAYSTASDLVRFGAALLNGSLLDSSTLGRLTAPRIDFPWAKGFQVGGAGRTFHFGYGGGAPGMNSLFRVFPRLGYTLVVLSNYDSGANLAGAYISEIVEASTVP